ncbi:hypothetical protein JG687_00018156 [Phytophthora cactorum]|uniref:Uncharacterized protein n=1 Tax=Phytophthora cactorum TaxID=29920 RepID=A0A8T1TPP6_9STRA|nr:hypothetical protein JG687_00018156 [Phytophthora cactorum]
MQPRRGLQRCHSDTAHAQLEVTIHTAAPITLRSMPEVFVLPHLCFSCSELALCSCCPIHSSGTRRPSLTFVCR